MPHFNIRYNREVLENYQPQNLEKDAIAAYFKTPPESLSQHWRNIVGVIEENGQKQFLKLATNNAISKHNSNEAEAYNRRSSGSYPLPIATPVLIDRSTYDNHGEELSWFKTEYIEGREISSPDNIDENLLREHLPLLADTAIAIMQWPQVPNMPLDIPKEHVALLVKEKISGWINSRLSSSEVANKAGKSIQLKEKFFPDDLYDMEIGPSHGDYVPAHFRITSPGELYLVDMEHTRMNWLKYYDAAYMYHRLYTKYKRPDIADEFLHTFKVKYRNSGLFDERTEDGIRLAIAQRLIGGYFDAVEDGVTSWELQDELSDTLLSESFE